ncbi:MAG: hypothetical protein V5A24_00720 [Haloarculaceae archaeon]
MASTLAEPAVLAAAKDALYPGVEHAPGRYAVTETQFTAEAWGDWPIPAEIRDRLAPYNAVRLASGEPDLLAVGIPDTEVLDADAAGTPVVAVEAKGTAGRPGSVDVGRGIEQAHSHFPEVNLGFVAVPADSVSETHRALARDLNVGIVGVDDPDTATVLEPARVTGAGDFSTDVDAIRFQARSHRLTEGSFPVNHPKNYLGYALALAAEGATAAVYADHVIRLPDAGRRGAILLGLVEERPDGDYLTHAGAEVVRFARHQEGGVAAALELFQEWSGKRKRFTEYAPRWAQLARAVAVRYEPTQLVLDALEGLHRDGRPAPTLPALAKRAVQLDRPLAVEVFFAKGARSDVLTREGDLVETALADPAVFKSGVHFQFKAQLFHVGLLTTGGTDDAAAALADEWRLEHPVGTPGV